MKGPVTQEWVHRLPFMQQTVLLTAVRGPDGIRKYHPCKDLLRWFRRCTLISALAVRKLDDILRLEGFDKRYDALDVFLHSGHRPQWRSALIAVIVWLAAQPPTPSPRPPEPPKPSAPSACALPREKAEAA